MVLPEKYLSFSWEEFWGRSTSSLSLKRQVISYICFPVFSRALHTSSSAYVNERQFTTLDLISASQQYGILTAMLVKSQGWRYRMALSLSLNPKESVPLRGTFDLYFYVGQHARMPTGSNADAHSDFIFNN